MKKKGGALGGLLVFFLVVIILGGVGFLGYNVIFKGNMNMSGMNTSGGNSQTKNTDSTSTSGSSNTQPDSSSKDSSNMSSSSYSGQTDMGSSSSGSTQTNYKLDQVNTVLQDKDSLDQALATINDSLKLMTLDPYAVEQKAGDAAKTAAGSQNPATAAQGNTTVNVYTGTNNQAMQSMGQTYDANKMEQLHSGLYKISVGMQLLGQLKDNIAAQVQQAGIDVKDPTQYYLNQYNTTLQNKNMLTNALTYLNDAADLININPYVGDNGAVYDKDRMSQLHESIYKLAEGVVALNKLNNNLLKQSVQLGNTAQNYSNQSQMNSMNMSSNPLANISFSTILTVLLAVFAIVFILALLGSVMSLFKSGKNQSNPE